MAGSSWTASCWTRVARRARRHRRRPPGGEEAGRRVRRAAPALLPGERRGSARSLLEAVAAAGVGRFVFSSSAAVYGMPGRRPGHRGHPVRADEPVRRDQARRRVAGPRDGPGARHLHGLPALLQRGGRGRPRAGRHGRLQPRPDGLRAARPRASRRASSATTTRRPDGTCVRDYIHVADLAEAHVAAARRLAERRRGDRLVAQHRPRRGRLGARDDRPHRRGHRPRRTPPGHARRRATRPASSPPPTASARSWAGRRDDVREMVTSAWGGWRLRHPEARG